MAVYNDEVIEKLYSYTFIKRYAIVFNDILTIHVIYSYVDIDFLRSKFNGYVFSSYLFWILFLLVRPMKK